jgi:hypothetical protein
MSYCCFDPVEKGFLNRIKAAITHRYIGLL